MKIQSGTTQMGLNYGTSNAEGFSSMYELEIVFCFSNQSEINLLINAPFTEKQKFLKFN